ncbi:MAG: hypothetical protein ACRYF1_01600 [Janthinobacterium lividum]
MTLTGNETRITKWNNTISRETASELGAFIFPPKTIIFPKVGGAMLTNKRRILTNMSCIDNNLMGCIVKDGSNDFTLLMLQQMDLGRICKPGPVPAIGEGEMREMRVARPKSDEQGEILRWLVSGIRGLEKHIEILELETNLISEFRTRLITDVVTGRLDIRAAAASLPAVAEANPTDADDDDLDEAYDASEDEEAAA